MSRRATALAFLCLITSASSDAAAGPFDKWRFLSQREQTFLRLVFSGDEAKATEFERVASINVNAIGGEPLSVWFYRLGSIDMRPEYYRNVAVHNLVFGRFRQNANPASIGDTNLRSYCRHAPTRQDLFIQVQGTPEQKQALAAMQEADRRPHVEAMAVGIDSLLRYGLKDRRLVTEIFVGCFYRNGAPLTVAVYDAVISKLVRAGVDVNALPEGERLLPIQVAVERLNGPIIQRLIEDGAKPRVAQRQRSALGFNRQLSQPLAGQCEPRREQSIYNEIFRHARTNNPTQIIEVVGALSKAGLSPLDKYGHVENRGGTIHCVHKSFYDAVVDTGNLSFAAAVKAAAIAPAPARSEKQPATVSPDATGNSPAVPAQFGAWKIVLGADRRPVAMANAAPQGPARFAGLRVECVAGGRLEYVPVAATPGAMTSLWFNDGGNVFEMKLSRGRASGASATTLSKEFAAMDAGYARGGQAKWTIEMSVESDNGPMAEMAMDGFSEMRRFMLANCKA